MRRFLSLFVGLCFGVIGGPAMALTCQDPHTGNVRESGTDSCDLGERQILPGEQQAFIASAAEVAAEPTAPSVSPLPPSVTVEPAASLNCLDPHTGAIRQSATGDCLLGERQMLPEPAAQVPARAPAVPPRQRQTSCLTPERAVVETEQLIRASLRNSARPMARPVARNAVTFASGQVIVEVSGGADSGTFVASLNRLSPQVAVEADPGAPTPPQARLTLTCVSGSCWTMRAVHSVQGLNSASFIVKDQAQAELASRGFARLIRLCGGGQVAEPDQEAEVHPAGTAR